MSAEPPPPLQVSPDGRFIWDGQRWVPINEDVGHSQTVMPGLPPRPQAPIPAPGASKGHGTRNGVIAVAFLIVVAGIFGSLAAMYSMRPSSSTQGYLHASADSAVKLAEYMQIAHSGSTVAGTFDSVVYNWSPSAGIGWGSPIISHYSLTGSDDGSQVSLTFTPDSQTGGAPFSRSGMWRGSNLLLNVPLSNGTLTTNIFVSATLAQYNAAVKAMG